MTARWHLGPVDGLHFWTVLAFSPEILVFLFFMLTDPKTVPRGKRERVAFGISVALLAALLVAFAPTEFWAKVAVLAALAIVCAARPLATIAPSFRPRPIALTLLAVGLIAYAGGLLAAGASTRPTPSASNATSQVVRQLPRIVIRPSQGVDSQLERRTARRIASDLQRNHPALRLRRVTLWLEAQADQFPAIVAVLEGRSLRQTVEVALTPSGYRAVQGP